MANTHVISFMRKKLGYDLPELFEFSRDLAESLNLPLTVSEKDLEKYNDFYLSMFYFFLSKKKEPVRGSKLYSASVEAKSLIRNSLKKQKNEQTIKGKRKD